ncbi:MAG: GlsB/YeaQ/YmgE family stress response membrane protein [Planctomycetaceae bacterium]|nr:GlsB/YeaQ/YmgE family stress response membrane protein [Planctomycetaceae bacterium]
MGWLAWIVLGLVAGILAKLVMGGSGGIITTTILGIIGAFVGGWLGTQLGIGDVKKFDLRSLGLATLGAIVVIALARILNGQV